MSILTTLTYALPHRLLSSLARKLAYSTNPKIKQTLIDYVVRKFSVDVEEAAQPDTHAYPSFNAFFTRELRAGVREPDPRANAIVMPADGHISQCGPIESGQIFQAKGHSYSVEALLGSAKESRVYQNGAFATIYLSPRDYHRVHMPFTGRLLETRHIPGRLFSVGVDAVESIPGLFARNERLVCHFETSFGPMAVVMVGALLVSGIQTVWSGEEVPPYAHAPQRKDYQDRNITLERFQEMARFNYGSTVIVLLPPSTVDLLSDLHAQMPVKLGQALALVRENQY